jgi:hypothetical protein
MIDTNGFLGWMVGSNVYHVHTREVTPAKSGLYMGEKGGIASEMKAIRGFPSPAVCRIFCMHKKRKKGTECGRCKLSLALYTVQLCAHGDQLQFYDLTLYVYST